MIELSRYKLIVFDCDGVILNSNDLKTSAFYSTALFAGEDIACRFANYHVKNGGVSRYVKFKYLVGKLLNIQPDSEHGKQLYTQLLHDYALCVKHAMLTCEMTTALESLKCKTSSASWVVASGSDQEELRYIFRERNIADYFNLGIFGSPTPKLAIVQDLMSHTLKPSDTIIVGDSFLDYSVSVELRTDFIFISGWSDSSQMKHLAINEAIPTYTSLACLSNDLC